MICCALRAEESPPPSQSSIPSPQSSLYDRFAPLYADFRLHVFPDDRREVAAALGVAGAEHLLEFGLRAGLLRDRVRAAVPGSGGRRH